MEMESLVKQMNGASSSKADMKLKKKATVGFQYQAVQSYRNASKVAQVCISREKSFIQRILFKAIAASNIFVFQTMRSNACGVHEKDLASYPYRINTTRVLSPSCWLMKRPTMLCPRVMRFWAFPLYKKLGDWKKGEEATAPNATKGKGNVETKGGAIMLFRKPGHCKARKPRAWLEIVKESEKRLHLIRHALKQHKAVRTILSGVRDGGQLFGLPVQVSANAQHIVSALKSRIFVRSRSEVARVLVQAASRQGQRVSGYSADTVWGPASQTAGTNTHYHGPRPAGARQKYSRPSIFLNMLVHRLTQKYPPMGGAKRAGGAHKHVKPAFARVVPSSMLGGAPYGHAVHDCVQGSMTPAVQQLRSPALFSLIRPLISVPVQGKVRVPGPAFVCQPGEFGSKTASHMSGAHRSTSSASQSRSQSSNKIVTCANPAAGQRGITMPCIDVVKKSPPTCPCSATRSNSTSTSTSTVTKRASSRGALGMLAEMAFTSATKLGDKMISTFGAGQPAFGLTSARNTGELLLFTEAQRRMPFDIGGPSFYDTLLRRMASEKKCSCPEEEEGERWMWSSCGGQYGDYHANNECRGPRCADKDANGNQAANRCI